MLIVTCTNGSLKIGGSFAQAKDMIKSVSHARFDPQTKVWSANVPMETFDPDTTGFPVDVIFSDETDGRFIAGAHINRNGKAFTREQWEAVQDGRAGNNDLESLFQGEFYKVNAELEAKLNQVTPAACHIARAIMEFTLEFDIRRGLISFSSPELRRKVFEIVAWYSLEVKRIYAAQAEYSEQHAARIQHQYLQ